MRALAVIALATTPLAGVDAMPVAPAATPSGIPVGSVGDGAAPASPERAALAVRHWVKVFDDLPSLASDSGDGRMVE